MKKLFLQIISTILFLVFIIPCCVLDILRMLFTNEDFKISNQLAKITIFKY